MSRSWGFPGRDCYTAAKGGVACLTRSLAVEFAPQRVRVNALAPSVTKTERVTALMAGNAAMQKIADMHLLGLGEPLDVAFMPRSIWPRTRPASPQAAFPAGGQWRDHRLKGRLRSFALTMSKGLMLSSPLNWLNAGHRACG